MPTRGLRCGHDAGALLGALAYVTFSFWCLIVPIVALLAVAAMVATRPTV